VTVYRVFIYLGANEWGNDVTRRVADEYAEQLENRPLMVSVHEHAGWHLSYLYGAPDIDNGTICGTANDGATLSQAVQDFGKGIETVVILSEIRR